MRQCFFYKFLVGPAAWCNKEKLAGVAVKKFHLLILFPLLLCFVEERGLCPISSVLCVMPVEVTDVVGGLAIAVPPEIVLHWRFGRSVRLGLHDAFVTHHCRRLKLWSAEADKLRQFF